jgi:hypothetical protein
MSITLTDEWPHLRVNNEEINKGLQEWEWDLADLIGRNRE